MTRQQQPRRRDVATALLALASRILPASHREWAQAMRAELDHVDSDDAALRWAFGCVLASVNQRMNAMLKLNSPISRPVLVLEWLMCFLPLTLLWYAGISYIVTYQHIPIDIVVATVTATLGPIALVVSLAATLTQRLLRVGTLARILAIAFAIMVGLQLTNAGAESRLNLQWFEFDVAVFVLGALLPLLGCLHIMQLSQSAAHTATRGRETR